MSQPDAIPSLWAACADGALTPEQFRQLEEILAADSTAVVNLVDHLLLDELLRAELAPDAVAGLVDLLGGSGTVQPRWRRRWVAILSGVVAAAAAAVLMLLGFWRADSTERSWPRVTALAGALHILGDEGGRPAAVGAVIRPGQSVRLDGGDSFAVLEYGDRTRLELGPGTLVQVGDEAAPAAKQVTLAEGTVRATVAVQPADAPMVLRTPQGAVHASGTTLALASVNGGAARIDLDHGRARLVRTGEREPMTLEAGSWAMVEGLPHSIVARPQPRVWTEPLRTLPLRSVLAAAVGADGREVLGVSHRQLVAWDENNRERVTPLPGSRLGRGAACFSSDRRVLAYCGGADRSVRLWDWSGQTVRSTLPIEQEGHPPMALAPDGGALAVLRRRTEKDRDAVDVWDCRSGTLRFRGQTDAHVLPFAFAPGGEFLAVGVGYLNSPHKNRILLWEPATGTELAVLPTFLKLLTALAVSPDGRRVAASFPGCVQVWDVPSRTLQTSIQGHERALPALAFSPDGRLLAGQTAEGEVWLWQLGQAEPFALFRSGNQRLKQPSFSSDGRQLVTLAGDQVLVWAVPAPQAEE